MPKWTRGQEIRRLEKTQRHPSNTKQRDQGRGTSQKCPHPDNRREDSKSPPWNPWTFGQGRKIGEVWTWGTTRKTEWATKGWTPVVCWETDIDPWLWSSMIRALIFVKGTAILNSTLRFFCTYVYASPRSLLFDLYWKGEIKNRIMLIYSNP